MLASVARVVIIWAIATVGTAQPYGTDLFVSDLAGTVFRITPAGQVTTLGRYGTPLNPVLWDLAIDADDRKLVGSLSRFGLTGGAVLRIDTATGVAITVDSSVGPWAIRLDQDGDYVASIRNAIVRVRRDGSGVKTLVSNAGSAHFDQDVTTGEWIVVASSITHYDPRFQTVRKTVGVLAPLTGAAVADPTRSSVYYVDRALFHYDPATGRSKYLPGVYSAMTASDYGIALDRAPGPGGAMIHLTTYTTTNRIAVVDRQGNAVRTFGAFSQQLTGIAFDRSRNLVPVLNVAPDDRFLVVSFAGDGGKVAMVVLGLSGCAPGVGLPDGRRIALNPDALTTLTAAGPISPWVINNTGPLDANGRRAMSLNLNSLGAALRGIPIWAVALSFDPNAPLGISQISPPRVIVP